MNQLVYGGSFNGRLQAEMCPYDERNRLGIRIYHQGAKTQRKIPWRLCVLVVQVFSLVALFAPGRVQAHLPKTDNRPPRLKTALAMALSTTRPMGTSGTSSYQHSFVVEKALSPYGYAPPYGLVAKSNIWYVVGERNGAVRPLRVSRLMNVALGRELREPR